MALGSCTLGPNSPPSSCLHTPPDPLPLTLSSCFPLYPQAPPPPPSRTPVTPWCRSVEEGSREAAAGNRVSPPGFPTESSSIASSLRLGHLLHAPLCLLLTFRPTPTRQLQGQELHSQARASPGCVIWAQHSPPLPSLVGCYRHTPPS